MAAWAGLERGAVRGWGWWMNQIGIEYGRSQ